jgi:ligand-binding sensor domain-containing protein/signal transduction histidine kinase
MEAMRIIQAGPSMWLTAFIPRRRDSNTCPLFLRVRVHSRYSLTVWIVLVLLAGAGVMPAAILWSEPGAMLVHDSGAGRDILDGALKRDDSSQDTLYFRFHVSPLSDSSTEEYYAAFELFEGDNERLGIGNALEAYAYSAFFATREPEGVNPAGGYVDLHSASVEPAGTRVASSYELPRRGQERTIVFKVQYVPNGDDLITVWLNPDLSAGATEIHQSESLTTRFSANGSFDEVRLRHGGRGDGWVFTDLAIATSFADFVDPSRAMSPAVDPGRFFDLQPFGFDAWLRDPGMPQAPIRALAQTIDGYLWLAGGKQLSRFDGVRFVPVSLPADFAGDTITSLFAGSDGALWVGTSNSGLGRYFGRQFDTLTAKGGLPADTVEAMAHRRAGGLWIGTTAGVVAWDQHIFQKFKGLDRLGQCDIRALFEDETGVLWIVASGQGLFEFKNGQLSPVTDSRLDRFLRNAECLLLDRDGKLWIGAGDDVVLCREGAEWHRYRTPRQSTSSSVRVLASTPDGTVWAGSPTEGLFRFKQGKLAALNSNAGLPEGQVSALLVDQQGDLWVGGGSGLHLLRRKPGFMLGPAEGLGHGIVSGLAEVSPGVIWVTQPGRGLYRWEGDIFRRLTAFGLSPSDTAVGAILVATNHACWLACTNGLLLFRDPQAAADEGLLFELPHASITALAEGQDGSIWTGTRQGQLWRLQKGRWRLQERFSSPCAITAMTTEPNGTVWVGTDGDGLYLVSESTCTHFNRHNGLAGDSVHALHRDSGGTFWIGTEAGGLTAISNRICTVRSTSTRLPANSVQGILEDSLGRLWLNQDAGLSCIAKTATGPGLEILEGYPLTSGRADEPFAREKNIRSLPQVRDSMAGRLWFGTLDGIVVMDPQEIATNTRAAALILEEVLVDGIPVSGFKPFVTPPQFLPKNLSLTPALRVGPGRHRLDFRYTSPQFRSPKKLRFRYRLEGLDRDWVEAGATRIAQYSYVPPGDYHFTVELYGANGRFERAGVGLSLSPHIWQRPWVIAATAVVLLAASGAGVRFAENRRMKRRLRKLEQLNVLERERIRIAQDLHDQMGAKLCRISFLSEHANRLEPSSSQMKEQVATIAHDSRELLHSLDEIVWAVNPLNDTLEHVGSYIGQYAQEYFQATGIVCMLEVASAFPHKAVSSQIRHHLFLAVHEALTNVLKHSSATFVKVAVSCNSRELQIDIEDNGRGFVPPASSRATSNAEEAGNGLRNMGQRIEAVGGRCEVNSAPGQGTTIRFVLNLALDAQEAMP